MLTVKKFEVNPFEECCYLLIDEASSEAVVVDPGMLYESERDAFDAYIEENALRLKAIVNTHLHLDHSFGINYLKDKYGIGLMAHPEDAFLGKSFTSQCQRFGLRLFGEGAEIAIDRALADGNEIEIGSEKLEVICVPGHTPGGVALYHAAGKFVLAGDSLFCGSIGRTDLAGGSHSQLIKSIKDRLLTLPDDTTVYPGHGPSTTIAREKLSNPYL